MFLYGELSVVISAMAVYAELKGAEGAVTKRTVKVLSNLAVDITKWVDITTEEAKELPNPRWWEPSMHHRQRMQIRLYRWESRYRKERFWQSWKQ